MYFFVLNLPENGGLISETSRRVQAYVWLLISVMCICWYIWMIPKKNLKATCYAEIKQHTDHHP